MAAVFISHSSINKDVAATLAGDLRLLGHSVWLDEWNIKVGQCIPSEIEKGLQNAHLLVLLLSKHAVHSKWVDREWKTAYWDEVQSNSIVILPVLLEELSVPRLLQTKRYANFVNSYAIGFRELTDAIEYYEQIRLNSRLPELADTGSARAQKTVGLTSASKPSRKLRLVTNTTTRRNRLSNVVSIGGNVSGSIVANSVRISPKGQVRMNYPEGSVGASIQMKNYLDYLIKRYYDYRKADQSFGAFGHSRKFHHAEIYTSIQSKFKAKAFFVPEELFDAECRYIQDRIDRTILGKRNKSRGDRNYSTFDEYKLQTSSKA